MLLPWTYKVVGPCNYRPSVKRSFEVTESLSIVGEIRAILDILRELGFIHQNNVTEKTCSPQACMHVRVWWQGKETFSESIHVDMKYDTKH